MCHSIESRSSAFLISVWLVMLLIIPCAGQEKEADEFTDPLASIYKGEIRSTVEVILEQSQNRRYTDENFPMSPEDFDEFRREIITTLEKVLGLEKWAVRQPEGKTNALSGLFRSRTLKVITLHDVTMEVIVIEIPGEGFAVPAVICIPAGSGKQPGVCVFSGHSKNGLRDLVVDLESYQTGIATQLAQAGFVTIAVEKVDAGYLSRSFPSGVDEVEITTHGLAWGTLTRTLQLKACLAAAEILAGHERVDERYIGATGVSLGGWLSVQTALLTDRINAVADFGRKTVVLPPDVKPGDYRGVNDLCHIIPGMLSLCDRNLLSLAYCPRPMLAGHGRGDRGSHQQAEIHFQTLFARQYEALDASGNFAYHIHDGGDSVPAGTVIYYFRNVFDK